MLLNNQRRTIMKKILIAMLAVIMVLSMAACGTSAPAATATDSAPAETSAAESAASGGDSVKTAATAYFANFESNPVIQWADLFALIDSGEEPFIVSIRQQADYEKAHIDGAYLASWGSDLAEKVAMLPADKKVYIYCYSGQTAGQTVALLRMLGIDAYSVQSGFNYGAMATEGYEKYVAEGAAPELPDAGATFDADVLAYVQNYFNTVADNSNFQIAPADAKTLIEAGEVTFVDVRKAEDFEAAHVDGAINIPFGKGMDFSSLPTDQQIIVTCYTGQTAGQTVAIMRALGYDAWSLQFGIKGAKGWITMVKAAAANAYFANFEANPVIKPEDLFAKMEAGDELFIVDIRQQADYDAGHLKGAYLAAWGQDLADKAGMLPTDKPVYIYCYTGQTAGQTVALLRMLGIDAYSVQSGYMNGISKVEGFEAYTDTTAAELPDAGASFDPFLLPEVQAYFAAVTDNGNFQIADTDAQALIDAGSVTVLDVRKAEDYAAGHIKGAVNIPFGKGMDFSDVPTDKQVIVTCYTGQTAGQTVAVLRMLGYNAVSLKGGMTNGWLADSLPTVTD
jgi:rhodanese-related sulfurtransferase/predicted small lipoprotein YifL